MNNNCNSTPHLRRVCLVTVVLFLCTILTQLTSVAEDEKSQLLRWKFAEGDRFDFDFTQELTQTTDVNGKKFEYQINFDLSLVWEVKSVDGEQATIEQSFRKLKAVWTSAKGELLEFDSESQEQLTGTAKSIAESLLPILKCKFIVVMNTRGEIVSVETDDKTKEILRSIPDSMAMRKVFTADGIRTTLSQAAIVLPETAGSSGDTWTVSNEIESAAGNAVYKRTYTLGETKKVDGKSLQEIKLSGEIEFEQAIEDDAKKPQEVTENEQSGTIWFNVDDGNFASSELKQTLKTETPYRDIVLNAGTTTKLSVNVKRSK